VTNPTDPDPAYIVYYSFGGKLVGMRRANQEDASTDGQYRIAGDHLGSTTLIVDTSSSPQVLQRQYYKPYGEVVQVNPQARPGYTNYTSIGYTGQRLDQDSGLMFYNARFYDPVLSYFVSADTIAPDKGDPKSRNRYSYVLNNPLRYTDPTGHCAKDKNPEDQRDCEQAKDQLKRRYGIIVTDPQNWTLGELLALLHGIRRMMWAMKWNTDEEFRSAVGIDTLGPIYLLREVPKKPKNDTGEDMIPQMHDGYYYSQGDPANPFRDPVTNKVIGRGIGITYTQSTLEHLAPLFIHELAHAWDHASGGCTSPYQGPPCNMAHGMDSKTGGDRTGAASKHGTDDAKEDWADAVAGYVFPEYGEYGYFDGNQYRWKTLDAQRRRYVEAQARGVTQRVAARRGR
jgi:RHS repeat-associated protein